jgi:hypothetical protein
MSTAKSRINVSIADDVKLAKKDQLPTATKAVRLMEIELKLKEDEIWDNIAAVETRRMQICQAP